MGSMGCYTCSIRTCVARAFPSRACSVRTPPDATMSGSSCADDVGTSYILRFAQDDNSGRMTIRTQILRFAQDDNPNRMTIRTQILRFAQDDNPEQDENSEG